MKYLFALICGAAFGAIIGRGIVYLAITSFIWLCICIALGVWHKSWIPFMALSLPCFMGLVNGYKLKELKERRRYR